MQLQVFSKHLVGLPLDEVARRLRAMGIERIDLTVRGGGHVEPERVEDDLPRAAQELARQGVAIGMLTTNITDAADANSEKILRIAQSLGIGFYKLGYYGYEGFGSLRRGRDEARAKVRDLGQLNAQIGICGGFHNHSDNFIGASLWDIDFVLEQTDTAHLGLYFDPAHASIEGGSKGWLQGLDLLQERVVMLAVKDYEWMENGGYAGGRRFKVRWCPLQQGQTRWPEVLQHLREIGFGGPVSLHSEYQGAHSFRDLSTDEVFEQTSLDARVFRDWMGAGT